MVRAGVAIVVSLFAAAVWADEPDTSAHDRPMVIAHRGASGHMPENTIEAFSLAIDQGADSIGFGLAITRDGALIASHDNELSDITDVATKFPDRRVAKTVEGRKISGWFAEDFTLAEIKMLRVRERYPFRNQANNGKLQIATLAEILELRQRKTEETSHPIGIHIDIKHSAYFSGLGMPLEEPLVTVLKAAELDGEDAPVVLQSADAVSLRRLKTLVTDRRVQNVDDPERVTDAALAEIAIYAQGIAPAKNLIVPVDANGGTGTPTDLVARAHRDGLVVYPLVFAPEPQFLPAAYGADSLKEYCQYARLGVDGVITDTPDLALKAYRESCPMP